MRANGIDHHVLEWGDPQAPAIVLCHGFLDLAWGFAELGPRLAAAGLRAIAFDFRGHGESGRIPPGGYYHFVDYVLDMHQLLPQLIAGAFHLLGHSMGGTACTYYAGTHEEQVKTLILLEGLGPLGGEEAAQAPARMKRWVQSVTAAQRRDEERIADVEEAYERLRSRHARVPESLLRLLAVKATRPRSDADGLTWRFDPLHRTPAANAFDETRFMHFIRAIRAPTLVIDGEHGFGRAVHTERAALLADGRRVTIAGAGHMVHWSKCEEVAQAVLKHVL